MKIYKNPWRQKLFLINKSFKDFTVNSWPINWSVFKKFNLLSKAFLSAPYFIKVIFSVFVAVLTLSVGVFGFGVYFLVTVDVAAQGGEFRELVIDSKVTSFNPVLGFTNQTEEKVTALLYHPLYKVYFPDFLQDPFAEPEIDPVLLETEPQWLNSDETPQENFKVLQMKLRSDIKWSDGTAITNDDVLYSFERIKEGGSGSEFNPVLQNYELVKVPNSTTEFEIRPTSPSISPNPQLIYLINFTPISKAFYQNASTSELKTSLRSLQPIVSSGHYSFPNRVLDPNSSSKELVDNPVRKGFDGYSSIVLEKNSNQNTSEQVNFDKYIFTLASQIRDNGGADIVSFESESKKKKVDLNSRYISPTDQITPQEIKDITNLEQEIVPTNTYFGLYLNMQASGGGLDGFFINQALRKYILCQFINISFSDNVSSYVNIIDQDKRLVPPVFNESYVPDCSNVEEELLVQKNARGAQIYKINFEERSGIKTVNIFDRRPVLNFITLEDSRFLAEEVQRVFLAMGLPINFQYVSSANLEQEISKKLYHGAFIPTTILTNNPYSIYGLGGRNIANIVRNERVDGRDIENTLVAYSNSNQGDLIQREKLVNFFKNEFVSLNLFRALQEVNYSQRIFNIKDLLPQHLTFSTELYNNSSSLYLQTRRRLR
jgi:hypothetical protein